MSFKKSIMVVEDSPEIREIIGRLYGNEGYNVMLARDGKDALEKLRNSSDLPCVILLDLMMSGMDGYRFRAEQGKDPQLSGIPVILMTADAQAKEKSIQVGANGYIRKPVEMETLLAVAKKYCPPRT